VLFQMRTTGVMPFIYFRFWSMNSPPAPHSTSY